MKSLKVLKLEADYDKATDRTVEIFDAQPGTKIFDELELLLVLIKDYEDKYYPIPFPDPIEAIKHKMEEAGLKNKDLTPIMGSEGHVSAILSGKRNLTLQMARDINEIMGIPAEVLIKSSSTPDADTSMETQLQESHARVLKLKALSLKLRNSDLQEMESAPAYKGKATERYLKATLNSSNFEEPDPS